MSNPNLSKSRYLAGNQCHLRLWYDSYESHLASPPDEATQARFYDGHEVGRLACERYPDGHLIKHDHQHPQEALEETRQVIGVGTAPVLFEAAFSHEGVLVRVDILERLSAGGWRLSEVKSSKTLKRDVHIPDVAVQLWVLRGAGLDVREVQVVTLNEDYVYDGVRLDLNALFKRHPLMEEADALQETVSTQVGEMLAMLGSSAAPNISPGAHCFTPYDCPYHAHCTRHEVRPEHDIDELPYLRSEKRKSLEESGIKEIKDIPSEFPLTQPQSIVRQSVCEQKDIVHGDIVAALAELESPIHYLDFETIAPAIPRFAGTSPYAVIPFQFSLHTERGAELEHTDYLHERDDDPRSHIADHLIEAVGSKGTICTYSHYEKTTVQNLAAALPERADQLNAILERLFDLLALVKNNYYHPEFRGSFSIKKVLPVLMPDMGYGDLEIHDGATAPVRYLQAIANIAHEDSQRTFADLRSYCERDTFATVCLRRALDDLGRNSSA